LLIRILPREEALGAPFEALYDGCDRFAPFIATAMAHDIGEIVKCSD
jgi:predicted HD phosphohydrolase